MYYRQRNMENARKVGFNQAQQEAGDMGHDQPFMPMDDNNGDDMEQPVHSPLVDL